jgi:hypothetical protein
MPSCESLTPLPAAARLPKHRLQPKKLVSCLSASNRNVAGLSDRVGKRGKDAADHKMRQARQVGCTRTPSAPNAILATTDRRYDAVDGEEIGAPLGIPVPSQRCPIIASAHALASVTDVSFISFISIGVTLRRV